MVVISLFSFIFLSITPIGARRDYDLHMEAVHATECFFSHTENQSLGYVEQEGGVPIANTTDPLTAIESTHIFLKCPSLGEFAVYDLCDLAKYDDDSGDPYCRVIPAFFPDSLKLLDTWKNPRYRKLFWCWEPDVDLRSVQIYTPNDSPCSWIVFKPNYVTENRPTQLSIILFSIAPAMMCLICFIQILIIRIYIVRAVYRVDKNVED